MRVVAGHAKGRRLIAPEGTTTRPTSDRVRESMFNTLFSLNALDGASVLDLYAGSGSLGIEALSRGAASCVFVEQDRDALDTIRTNIETLGLGDSSVVVAADVPGWLASTTKPLAPYDLICIDPPYKDEPWEGILNAITGDVLTANGLVVAESSRPLVSTPGWDVVRDKKYGTTLVTVLERSDEPDRTEP